MLSPQDLLDSLHKAAVKISDDAPAHPVGSPSSVYSCLRRQWYSAKGVQESNVRSLKSLKKMASGKAIEDYWHEVYRGAGFKVYRPKTRLPIYSSTGELLTDGEIDGVLEQLEEPHHKILLELKDLGIWTYTGILEKGLENYDPGYYVQLQLYLHAALEAGVVDQPYAVFHAGMADSSAVVWIWKAIKKKDPADLPDVHIQVIGYDPIIVNWAMRRIDIAKLLVMSDSVPAREYDPEAMQKTKGGGFPCGKLDNPYCPWLETCIKDAGTTVRMEYPAEGKK